MSLAQHVTQAEGFDYEGPAGAKDIEGDDVERASLLWPPAQDTEDAPEDNKISEWRRLSYAPVVFELEEPTPRDAAYKVSNFKRGAQVFAAVIANWLASGIVFGFAALKPVLIAEGVYSDLCEKSETDPDLWGYEEGEPCPEQTMRLNMFFIVASITANMGSLLAGATLDRFGRRFCWIVSSGLLAIASLLMAFSFAIPEFEGYIAGNILFALGGTYLFVPSFELANSFPKHSGLVVALITGAFDASAAVFLFYRITYERTEGGFSPARFFFLYLIVPFLILLTEICLMPPNAYHTVPELEKKIEKAQDPSRDAHSSDHEISDGEELTRVQSARADRRQERLGLIEEIVGDAEQREERVRVEEDIHEASGVWGVLHGMSFARQMRSPWYILMLLLTATQMFRMNYFIASIRSQYRFMLDSEEKAEGMNHFFDIALPVGGIIATPVIGLLLNNLSVAMIAGLLTVLIIVVGVFNCISAMWAGYVTIVVFVLFRPLYYSAISDYATKVFGFKTFGRIYGTVVCISGITNFAQSALDALVLKNLGGDPLPVNIFLGIIGAVVGIALTTFVAIKGREFVQEKEELEEQQPLRSEEYDGYGATD